MAREILKNQPVFKYLPDEKEAEELEQILNLIWNSDGEQLPEEREINNQKISDYITDLKKKSYVDMREIFKEYQLEVETNRYPVFTKEFIKKKVLEQMAKENRNLCYIFMDLDGLKAVNDIGGHKKGDNFLKKSMEIIQEAVVATENKYLQKLKEALAEILGIKEEELEGKGGEDLTNKLKTSCKFYISSHGGDEFGFLVIGPNQTEENKILEDLAKEWPELAKEKESEVRKLLKLDYAKADDLQNEDIFEEDKIYIPPVRRRADEIFQQEITIGFDDDFSSVLTNEDVINKLIEAEGAQVSLLVTKFFQHKISEQDLIKTARGHYGHLSDFSESMLVGKSEKEIADLLHYLAGENLRIIGRKYDSFVFLPSISMGKVYMAEESAWADQKKIAEKIAILRKKEVKNEQLLAEYSVFLDVCDQEMYAAKNEYKLIMDGLAEVNTELTENLSNQLAFQEKEAELKEMADHDIPLKLRQAKKSEGSEVDPVEAVSRLKEQIESMENLKEIVKKIILHAEISSRNDREMRLVRENRQFKNVVDAQEVTIKEQADRIARAETENVELRQSMAEKNRKIAQLEAELAALKSRK